MDGTKRFGRKKDVARMTGLSLRMIDRLITDGMLPAAKIGRAVVIDLADVEAMIEARKRPAA